MVQLIGSGYIDELFKQDGQATNYPNFLGKILQEDSAADMTSNLAGNSKEMEARDVKDSLKAKNSVKEECCRQIINFFKVDRE